MLKLILALLILSTSSLFAGTKKIHSIHPQFLRFDDGTVGHWSKTKPKSLINLMLMPGLEVQVTMNEVHEITAIRPTFKNTKYVSSVDTDLYTPSPIFKPSLLTSLKAAQKLMNNFNGNALADSQCYDRAHIWALEAKEKNKITLGKAWVFFADHYIMKNKFKWWFHVAPLASVDVKGVKQTRVMDKGFSTSPLKMNTWTDLFTDEGQECKKIERYTEFSEHALEDDCYLLESSPFFWQPRDLEEFAKTGFEKTTYISWEVKRAYEYAFGIKKDFQ